MNSGHWPQATHVLRETIAWMQEHRDEPHQHRVEEGSHLVSLRRDDIWLGCYQHMGLVLGKSDVRSAVGPSPDGTERRAPLTSASGAR